LDAAGRTDDPDDAELASVLEAYLADLEAGRPADPERVLTEHPTIADRLRACLIGLHHIEHGGEVLGPPTGDGAPGLGPARLGEYRLVREVGRGGMGVVYEAVQESLGRRVALKVLPFAATLDPRQLQRFRNEALAAAQLHHTNIVPVFGVGCERGIHYYAMQFIDGRTLAAVIRQLRPETRRRATAPLRTSGHSDLATPDPTAPTHPEKAARAEASTLPETGSPDFYRAVARLGVQAAEALEHAHQAGVVHRDVKPANLMVEVGGHLWVADFGLAHLPGTAGLTLTGDLVGTLRYASPEQIRGHPGGVDHRTDVYSLGITLYELLTLEPAYDGRDRPELLRRLVTENPVPPRQRDREIPAELETIVLKAMEKNPADRYATARELADDLGRFVADAPIRARRPTVIQRLRRWGRQHQPVVWSAAVFGLLTMGVVAASLGWVARDREARDAAAAHDKAVREAGLDEEVSRILDGASTLLEEGKWIEARAPVEQADKLLTTAGRAVRPTRLEELRREVAMAERLEGIYTRSADEGPLLGLGEAAGYDREFREFGIDVAALPVIEAAARVRARSLRVVLARALDFWTISLRCNPTNATVDWKKLSEIASSADPDHFLDRWRDALARDDRASLWALAESRDVGKLPAGTLVFMGYGLIFSPGPAGNLVLYRRPVGAGPPAGSRAPNDGEKVLSFLRRAQRQYPTDLKLNLQLAHFCRYCLGEFEEAQRYFTVALALRPASPFIAYYLGHTMQSRGRLREAVAEYSRALELDPAMANVRLYRGEAHFDLGHSDVAAADFSRAIELGLDNPHVRFRRGVAHMRLGHWDLAVGDLSQATGVDSRYRREAQLSRAYTYSVLGRWGEAEADLTAGLPRGGTRSLPAADVRWHQLACLRLLRGDAPGYRQLCRQLIDRAGGTGNGVAKQPAYIIGRTCLLHPDGGTDGTEAARWTKNVVAGDPRLVWDIYVLALTHYRAGRFEQAVKSCHDSLRADPRWGGTPLNWLLLAMTHHRLDQPDLAREYLDKAASWRRTADQGSSPRDQLPTPPDTHLSDWLEFQVLYREAASLLGGAGDGS
jgi:serine/threonine protein kinase/tetratricopeptide (TPR) repeat protein